MNREKTRGRAPACVLAVDDHARFRSVLRDIVAGTHDLVVIGEADSGEAAVRLAGELAPDLVLMDLRMPGMDGIEATRAIKERTPSTIVVLVSGTSMDSATQAEVSVADEFVWKNQLHPDVLDQIWRRHRATRPPIATSN
jgi:DNA-binding NarL/FixJ family response regulator